MSTPSARRRVCRVEMEEVMDERVEDSAEVCCVISMD
jgi:hypothetical protein